MISPNDIPQITGDLDKLDEAGTTLQTKGGEFGSTGSDVHTTWQGLAAYYVAPEADRLFAATGPVQQRSATVSTDLKSVGTALVNYAAELRPIKERLHTLYVEADAFVKETEGDEDWRKDGDKVNKHNGLLSDVNGQMSAFMAAQRTCANAINRIWGGTQWVEDNADGKEDPNEFGYSKDTLDQAAGGDDGLPWGKPEERDKPWYEDAKDMAVSYAKGIWVDGVWGTIKGLGNLVGFGGWDAFKESWAGLGKLALVITFPELIAVNMFVGLPGMPKGTLPNFVKDVGKGLVAWDTWKKDPARAAGNVVFNVVSVVFGTKGAGTTTKVIGAAAKTEVGIRVTAKVAEIVGKIKSVLPEIKIPDFLKPVVAYAYDEDWVAKNLPDGEQPNIPHGNNPGDDIPTGDHDPGGTNPADDIPTRNQPGQPSTPGNIRDFDTYRVDPPDGMSMKDYYDELTHDPADGYKITQKSQEEAQAGLSLVERGDIPGPIRRDPTGGAEFTDATGQDWDVKTYHPEYKNGFDLAKIERDLRITFAGRNPEKIIFNTSYMSPGDVQALRGLMESKGWGANVKWYP